MIEMISRRLTKNQKAEILNSFREGDSSNSLAKKYSCTANTIIRTVKTFLSDSEYKSLKEKRSEIINKQVKIVNNQTIKENEEDIIIDLDEEIENNEVKQIAYYSLDEKEFESEALSSENEHNHQNIDNNFELIEPLSFDFDQVKEKSVFEILNFESLPESVYMIVDRKVELELQLISDLPEWSFLPENELKRNAILLFANQRSAKRSCSRNQRVIKIPNTSVFKLSQSYLISKGITRLILEDSIIALDD